MKKYWSLIIPIQLLSFSVVCAPQPLVDDSVKVIKKQKVSTMRLTTRLSSMGLFSFAGRVVSDNPALDFNFTYDSKQFGFSFYKAMDLYDHRTDNNFALALLYHHFKLGKRWTVTPNIGFVMDQTRNVAGSGSDASVMLNTSFKINNYFTIDNTAIMPNMVIESSDRDWINRFRILYSKNHLDVTMIVWHNNKAFDHTEYLTTGLNVTFARIAVNDHLFINTGITAMYMPYSNDKEEFPRKNGLVFTVSAILH